MAEFELQLNFRQCKTAEIKNMQSERKTHPGKIRVRFFIYKRPDGEVASTLFWLYFVKLSRQYSSYC